MVRDIEWKAACDNCFCAMGAVRCVPLACAPPLQDCSPIVREGQCCPSTYNCSGGIEVKAIQNYASYAFISKDYAKFRKEPNFVPTIDQSTYPSVEGRGHRVVEEQVSTGAIDLEEDSSVATYSTAWPSTMETDIMDNEILIGTVDYKSTLEVTTAAISTNELSSNTESTAFEPTLASSKDADSVTDSCATCSANTLTDSTIAATTTEVEDPSNTDGTTISSPEWTTVLPELTLDNGNDENEDTGGSGDKNASENEDRNEHGSTGMTGLKAAEKADIIEKNKATTHPFAISTDAGQAFVPDVKSPENSTLAKRTGAIGKRPVTSPSSTILMPEDILVMNVTVKTNVSVGHIQGVTINPIKSILPDVEAILNITHREKGEDYDYDYSGQALLPNVRIIPFVAADALVNGKDDVSSPETGYSPGSVVVASELRPTDASGFYDIATQENRFSPPVETEGGFVPREPSYFDVPYHSTDLNLEIGTGVTVVPAQITNPHRKNDDLSSKCRLENMEYRHGEILPSTALCIICMCYYGEIVCSSEKCPPLKIGCRRITSEGRCCGEIVCVKADESPTVVLNRAGATAPSQRQPTVSPDPFRDVIKTEPAPDLPSLIEDMIRGITTSRPTTSVAASKTQGLAGNHPSNFDFMEQVPLIRPPFDYGGGTVDSPFISGIKYDASSKDTVSLTYESEDRFVNREKVFGTFNRTNDDDSRHGLRRGGNEQKRTESEDRDGKHSESENGSSTVKTVRDDVFSLDNVLELLFSSNTTATERTPDVSPVSGARQEAPLAVSSTSEEGLTEETAAVETSSKVLDNEIPTYVGSLLKLAGCNIYGRMYRVGRIIAELSNPCLECRCAEIGVQCKPLKC
ncbi:PREDICTED: uncharacterized protein LOC106746172 [Dinoponera quadriceps]|uniref:Uncharacterized protein LOC106746172 n=1 Tax=Dinoponera quadriceps TaxID=609295 RepID=A0A6P3XHH0_DINQU|nr:PREDICTED: uncharacterized protein LOC106746172 [Dinoponera quadriceps]